MLALIAPLLADPDRFTFILDPKTALLELAAVRSLPQPVYELTGEGPDHDRRYTAVVTVGKLVGSAQGTSKKAAELAAARNLLAQLNLKRG